MTAPAQDPSPEAMAAAKIVRDSFTCIDTVDIARALDAFAAKRVDEELVLGWNAAITAAALRAERRSLDKRFGDDIRKLKRGTK